MEWIIRLNKAVNYIEEHLTENIDIEEVAKIACCSSYHFQRMFAYMSDMTLSEYIRKRKMSLAAAALQDPQSKVIDVGMTYGYTSPTAFNRAFKGIHGIAPSAVKDGHMIKAFPPISFKMTIKGAEEMNYRIEKKEAFKIVGISEPLNRVMEENFKIVPSMWQRATEQGHIMTLSTLITAEPFGLLGVSICNDLEDWRYFIAVASKSEVPEFDHYQVPASTWAIFSGKGGTGAIQELEKRIVSEWLPTSGYEYGQAPDIEVYKNSNPEDMTFEIWIPVIRKQEVIG